MALFAVGGGAFQAEPGAGLAWVYLGLAAIAATSALVLAPSLERARPVKALAWLLVVAASLVIVVAGALVLAVPGVPRPC